MYKKGEMIQNSPDCITSIDHPNPLLLLIELIIIRDTK